MTSLNVLAPAVDGAAFWAAVFGRVGPVEIEIGSGDGAFLLAVARHVPAHLFLGIERSPSKARRLEARLARADLDNVRTLQADATCVVTALIPSASVTTYHVYFPDPWPKRGHAGRRIFRAPFIGELARTLVPDGRLQVATDVEPYARLIDVSVLGCGRFAALETPPGRVGMETTFARKYRAGGRILYAAAYRRTADAASDQLSAASQIRSR